MCDLGFGQDDRSDLIGLRDSDYPGPYGVMSVKAMRSRRLLLGGYPVADRGPHSRICEQRRAVSREPQREGEFHRTCRC